MVTDERAAADAVHAGDLKLALQIYQRLASDQPDNPAFARAIKLILRAHRRLRNRLPQRERGVSAATAASGEEGTISSIRGSDSR